MSLRLDISPIDRLVMIVAAGQLTAEEIAATIKALIEANVPAYDKIVDVSQATSELTREQVIRIATLLRGPEDERRGAVAFVIAPARIGAANLLADLTSGERPIQLFRSIHQARAWLRQARQAPSNRQAG